MKLKPALQLYFLIFLGSLQMIGEELHLSRLKGFAAATQVAPNMKVFTAHEGYETHAAGFSLHWQDASGASQSLDLNPATYSRVTGPYNRRNIYGAALAYGPLLRRDPRTRALQESVMHFAFCTPGILGEELGVPRDARNLSVEILPTRIDARQDLELSWGVDCHG